MPSTLFIISDMEFNSAMENPDKNPFITTQKLHLKPKAIICQLLYFIMSTAGRCRLQSNLTRVLLSQVVPEPTPSTTNLMGNITPDGSHAPRLNQSPLCGCACITDTVPLISPRYSLIKQEESISFVYQQIFHLYMVQMAE